MQTASHISPASRRTLIRFGFVALACTLAMTSLYRPWIHARGYFDFFIADTAGSFGGALMATLLLPGFFCPNAYCVGRASLGAAIGAVIYEFVQPLVGTGVFDVSDVIASIIGGTIGVIVVIRISDRAGSPAKPEPNQPPQHNAGIGPAILDSAIPPRPALSSEETARPQSPRG